MADSFLERATQFFLSKGYPPHSAAALAANAVAESGGNTRAVHDQGTGVGIYGFRDPTPGSGRKTALMQFAQARGLDPYAENTQLAYAAHELDTNEKAAGDKLKNAKDYREAQVATIGYLRPHFYNPDPSKQTIPADRWNPGASVAGVQPMPGGTSTGGGYTGSDTDSAVPNPSPNTGLLAAVQAESARQQQLQAQQVAAQAAAAEAAKSKEQDAEYAALQKQGMGLLQANTGQSAQPPQFLAPPQMAQAMPQQEDGMPDFRMRLAQQRLARRV